MPRYDHVVVVIEENHAATEVLPSPYLASLAQAGMVLTRSFAVAHPSQPNYLALVQRVHAVRAGRPAARHRRAQPGHRAHRRRALIRHLQ